MAKAADYVPYDGPIVTRAQARAAGLRRFFTGIPCKHGHIAQRQTIGGKCFGCRKPPSKDYMAAWHAAHPGKRASYQKAYEASHKEEKRLYYEQNFDRIHARNRAWRQANQEAYRKAVTDWHKAHPDRIKEIHRDWVIRNPERVAANDRAQRARRLKAEGRHTAEEVLALLEKQRGKCVYCSVSIRSKYHADHIVPLARGGTNWITNIQLTCPKCNFRKNRTDPILFAQRRGLLI